MYCLCSLVYSYLGGKFWCTQCGQHVSSNVIILHASWCLLLRLLVLLRQFIYSKCLSHHCVLITNTRHLPSTKFQSYRLPLSCHTIIDLEQMTEKISKLTSMQSHWTSLMALMDQTVNNLGVTLTSWGWSWLSLVPMPKCTRFKR
jgi:hypothetical protein